MWSFMGVSSGPSGGSSLPSQCIVEKGSNIADAVDAFKASNAVCDATVSRCVQGGVNATCGRFVCDAGLDTLADACVQDGGTFCAGKGSGKVPIFTYSTAVCLPASCSEGQRSAVEAFYAASLCGELATAKGGCVLTLECSYALTTGDVLGVVFGSLGLFLLLLLACWAWRRHQQGTSPVPYLGESTQEPPAGGGYVELGAAGNEGDGRVGNDAVLESGPDGL